MHSILKIFLVIRKKIFFLVISVFLINGCVNTETKNYSKPDDLSSDFQTIIHQGVNREYVLYVPDSYDGSFSVPVVLNFHGFSGDAYQYMNEADMRRLAEAETFILIYPQGLDLDGEPHWNACPNGGDNKSDIDDFGFIETLVEEVSSNYNIDLERIYAVGYSNGGMMAYGLANHKSELIAAVASVSGAMLDCTGPTSHPMPVIHLHGTDDFDLPYNGNNYYNSVQNTLDYWTNFNNTNSEPIVNFDNIGEIEIEHYIYNNGNNSVSVEHYKYIGGDHLWFMSSFQGQNTSELVWNFLSRYDLNGLR
ncbi:MAG: hypothetical protein CBC28_00270 [Flavobacteriaceae bacterium TMED68]|nr:MAG: hypothetical protein CBC28_00270 [Flavobacteriaceae bacterium TMED68]|tara:strand:+ start:3698 stop:4618 length:921 start_codon:yes stop_codon:yes gene_type:complete